MLLDDLLSQTRLVTVKYGDSELNIEYYRQRLMDVEGQRLMATFQAFTGFSAESFALSCQMLTRLIAWWDLYESEGVPLAVTLDNVSRLPLSVVSDIFVAIMENESKPPQTITVRSDA